MHLFLFRRRHALAVAILALGAAGAYGKRVNYTTTAGPFTPQASKCGVVTSVSCHRNRLVSIVVDPIAPCSTPHTTTGSVVSWGSNVALSPNGKEVIITAPSAVLNQADPNHKGYVSVLAYDRKANTVSETQRLLPPLAGNSSFGQSLALAPGGKVLAIGDVSESLYGELRRPCWDRRR